MHLLSLEPMNLRHETVDFISLRHFDVINFKLADKRFKTFF